MTGAGAGPGTGPLAAGPTGDAMTGNVRELGGSFALGPWHARRAGYGAIQLADDGVLGREPESSQRSMSVPFDRT
jgi:hypothetical protein